MSEITEFLLARIAEDEDVAKGVRDAGEVDSAGGWSLQEPYHPGGWATVRGVWVDVGNTTAPILQPATADHLLRFDPTRVLAECEAKRQVIAIHPRAMTEDTAFEGDYPEKGMPACDNCRGDEHDEWYREPYPCATLKALALPYADHPDYDPAWS